VEARLSVRVGFSLCPATATSGQTYSVAITGASASLGATDVSLSVGSAKHGRDSGSGIADHFVHRAERRDVWRVAVHRHRHGEFGSGGELCLDHDFGLHSLREHRNNCRRGFVFDRGESGGQRHLRGGDAGDAEFHGQSGIADHRFGALSNVSVWGVAVHRRRHGEFGSGGGLRLDHDFGLHSGREHGDDRRRGRVFDHGEPGGQRELCGGDAGGAEFHGQLGIADQSPSAR
jgi:hypothetical protein